MRQEFTRLAEEEPYSPDLTRKIAKNRQVKAVLEGTPSNVSRGIELLGKFREHDWWVRNSEAELSILMSADRESLDDYLDK